MTQPVGIIGSPISPYVRKVLVFLVEKNVPFEIDPLVPFYANDKYEALNPLRRIPVLVDDRVTLADSSVICQYLEDRYPRPALYPADLADRARARWFEEYADTRMCDVMVVDLFFQLRTKRAIWGTEPDAAIVERAREKRLPKILEYLEKQVPREGFLFGEISIADIALAAPFRNLAFARVSVDADRWPLTVRFVERVLAHPSVAKLIPIEERLWRTPIPQQRGVLAELGWEVMSESYSAEQPRRPGS